ncbi:retrovirus-related Pol polyprotein from transposon 412 [Trichonephila clavipes]|nr:retrovirus-related Pol polyprotein from transposon 412 [Trichonephila clavipes]
MDEQLNSLLEGINALKSGQEDMQKSQEETKERIENMQRIQEETKERMENMQRSQEETKERMENMQKSQEATKNELKNRMQKGLENVQKCQEVVEEKVAVVEEKIEKKVEQVEERIREQIEEKYEEVAGNFSLISQRVEDLEKKLLVSGNKNESKILPSSPVHVSTSPVPVTASTVGEAAEILQTLPDTERLNLNSLYNALDLRFSQKYSKDYVRLQMKTRLQKTGESSQEYASEVERLANLAFSDHPATVREVISLQYFVDGLKDGEIQKAVRMADVQDIKSVLLYALKLAATQASRRDRQSIRGARVTAGEPCESRLLKEMEKLKEEMKTMKAGISNQEKRSFKCWGCGGTGHLRRNCPRARKEENTVHGKANVTLRFGNIDYHHTAYIADITDPCILGQDFLKNNNFKLDFENSNVHSKFEDITLFGLQTQFEYYQKIIAKTKLSLSPRTECIIPGLVAENRKFRFGLIDYPDSDNSKGGVLITSSVVDLSKSVIPVRVANISDKSRTIQEGEVIAACAPVTCVDRKCNSQDHYSDDLVKNLLQNIDLDKKQRCAAGELITEFQSVFSRTSEDFGRTRLTKHRIDTAPPTTTIR